LGALLRVPKEQREDIIIIAKELELAGYTVRLNTTGPLSMFKEAKVLQVLTGFCRQGSVFLFYMPRPIKWAVSGSGYRERYDDLEKAVKDFRRYLDLEIP
jgi:hypothetical protein